MTPREFAAAHPILAGALFLAAAAIVFALETALEIRRARLDRYRRDD